MDLDDEIVLEIAQKSINEIILNHNAWVPDLNIAKYQNFQENQGAFTTIYSNNEAKTLRGCIGVPHPDYPLGEAIAISSRNSATKDPRFPPITISEMDKIIIEVEVLSAIVGIQFNSTQELIDQVNVGIDGLIVRYMNNVGLLLPKVGSRYNWSPLELIENTCVKAGLRKDAYEWKEIEFHKFTSTLFAVS